MKGEREVKMGNRNQVESQETVQFPIGDWLSGFSDLTVPLMVSAEVLELLPVEKIQWLFGLTLTHVDDLREQQLEVGSTFLIGLRSELVEEYVMKCLAVVKDQETGLKKQYKMFFTEHNDIPYDGIFYITDNWESLNPAQRFILLETEQEYLENYKERKKRSNGAKKKKAHEIL